MAWKAGTTCCLGVWLLFAASVALAHDPVFGPGPHVLYKNGVEVHLGVDRNKAGRNKETEFDLELSYGLTGDWSAGIELPYVRTEQGAVSASGLGDARLFTKYRFWRHDTLGVQESAAALLQVKLESGDEQEDPPLGSGSTDTILGLTYGYESLKWYRWAGIRYRRNGENDAGLQRGDKWLLDIVAGWRPRMPEYLKPDTVWLLELNGEYGQRAKINGATIRDTGGREWFLSPGIFWTRRNFAVKAGVQIPVASDLNGGQAESEYRGRLTLEWHL